MSNGTTLTQEEHRHQISCFTQERPSYKSYATALKRVLEQACSVSLPEAIIQSRAKTVASFAEKCVRKWDKYKPNPLTKMTDLCGARVIVHTLDQIQAVRDFIRCNFEILEEDEKGLMLGKDKFGYRDFHFLIKLNKDRAPLIGFSKDEMEQIGPRIAELQIRTTVQHAWADILHDRMYKTKLIYPPEFQREGALLAAIMEDGDRQFNGLANDIDGMLTNFNVYAAKDDVEKEIGILKLICDNSNGTVLTACLQLARLMAAKGEFASAVDILSPHATEDSPLHDEILLELGSALCKSGRNQPNSDGYRLGKKRLQEVIDSCRNDNLIFVPNLRKRRSLEARALARLAWACEADDEEAARTRQCYREALELEPDNPYYLADVIGHEINCQRRKDFVGAMAFSIRRAIETCSDHIQNGTEMPYAALTAARLHLLIDEPYAALGAYARGIHHIMAGATCVPDDTLAIEKRWLLLVTKPEPLSGGYRWAMDLLRLADRCQKPVDPQAPTERALKTPVLIVAGGAASLSPEKTVELKPLLAAAFAGYRGTVFSGGTRVGVPGCVGEVADAIAPRGNRTFAVIGYLPRVRPSDAPTDERYDEWRECGEHSFTPEQILTNWSDIFAAGRSPDQVRLLGFGGGPLSEVEYHIALGLGACVGLVQGSGGAADSLLGDGLWSGIRNMLPLPSDPSSVRAFVQPPEDLFERDVLEKMGMVFHEEYVRNSTSRLPDNMKPWEKLSETYKTANREQAKYAIQILKACGFTVIPSSAPKKDSVTFSVEEIERMAELEHGRWNIERLRDGWRLGPRDDAKKRHPCLVPWTDEQTLTEEIKGYDRSSVKTFPDTLAQAGLEIHRL